ncbi:MULTISPECIES: hypothetical protein [unclassified Stenotrophomonas]|uniref:hypothetical protein n=1 Tax=unclassified Stenotrophomonas TaxID=196198 RepID=UPI00244D36CC|nr:MULTISPECIES: hypothetical protein [unclassified Stenotrophomonas]EKT4089028.1 hypothetical protein [Stenotrophomonas maltophilia]MBN5161790.1 hypothetical protein [Stenotrophomonas maltophilia]MDG9844678.1 hypothetical protein [Stenotrophomonas sp. GD04054]MDH0017030.1 hypothetical protein [Stenotrophomonas sp. GD04028]MDH0577816.1 hypothetical protein [Stenotrophomonas sp. GD03997]
MHNESPLPIGRVEPCSTDEKQPTNGRLYNSEAQPTSGRLYQGGSIEQQRQRARRTAMWVGAIAVLVYVGFILSGVIGR